MRLVQFTAALLLAFPAAIHGQEEHRQLGPHEHGHGTLAIGIEGSRVTLELQAPGFDIVGFEHAASTPEQKAAIEKAKATLADPLALFKLPAAAGCKLAEAKIEISADHHDHDGDKHEGGGHGAGKHDGDKDAGATEAEHEHSGVDADYALECTKPEAITQIEFDYFKTFAGAQALSVELATTKGQTKMEVTREKPRLELGGLI